MTERWTSGPDDERAEETDYDPRWEVQPGTDDTDDAGGDLRMTLITLLVAVVVVGLLGWLLLGTASIL